MNIRYLGRENLSHSLGKFERLQAKLGYRGSFEREHIFENMFHIHRSRLSIKRSAALFGRTGCVRSAPRQCASGLIGFTIVKAKLFGC
ncbi:hypothetical protein EVAR_49118_1 [Eumeta japonica]|uniref:Uncharacterized protein n=1 Tax=Eumeta variegata TaxID=151549 RepID=A0A4C1YQD5_EUMVA|nr:hypothetical protein EVAR_49118_1 [Eumeta japonica]